MPELPEVEVLIRHLRPILLGQAITSVTVHRPKVLGRTSVEELTNALLGATFRGLERRGKYLLFVLSRAGQPDLIRVLGHLGMSGRMFLLPAKESVPKHSPVVLGLGRQQFVFEDPRYFGRFTLDTSALERLGPEPLGAFTWRHLLDALSRSRQAVKIRLLDQTLVAGVGNIYASEVLFAAGISPLRRSSQITAQEARQLKNAIGRVLREAIRCGSTVPLRFGSGGKDRLFYFGRAKDTPDYYEERLRVYGRSGRPCVRCKTPIRRIVQAGRATYFCPQCQSRIAI